MNTKIINATPHNIKFILNWYEKDIPSSWISIRCESEKKKVWEVNWIGVNKVKIGKPIWLPKEEKGVIYIVSRIVAESSPNRKDLYMVDETVRDSSWAIIGCKSLSQI